MPYTKNPTSYLGVKSRNPPNMFIKYRRPTINDIEPFNMGDFWVIPKQKSPLPSEEVWEIVDMQQNQASWVQLNASESTVFLNHQILVGTGTTTIGQLPLGTVGQALLSGGSSADPSWGVLTVPFGGTSTSSFVPYSVVLGGTSSTSALQSVASVGVAGQILTSRGAGMTPQFEGTGGGGAFTNINVQTFTTTGTYTPTTGMIQCVVECLGGGGAGGGSVHQASYAGYGSGGGGGGYCRKVITAATIGASQTVTIGAGGTGVSGNTGNTGGNTTFGAILTGNGGVGGTSGAGSPYGCVVGGIGGTASGGDINVQGQYGNYGSSAVSSGSTSFAITGGGANSQYGVGGLLVARESGSIGSSVNGNNGIGYGSGGSGSVSPTGGVSSGTGGSGASGLVIVTEYIQ